ncbi:CotS family spore coat protein [Clostridium tagluense]|uniref:CotS family spore coat protein n=1 Tax=Clostridium tagluense TaxID=360422 RepID=UPI001C6E0479|nr:CotS family spore coat protein [Clostridium tagluense]MBW9155304.1 CotS family spore coat protein [Clostridium tagluense]WLC65944.1 CotS family spore coat protein [Clostridium tagluense]
MLDVRYKDKTYLSKYDLDVNLFSEFDLLVSDVIPVRKVFILNTDKGDKVLKKVSYSVSLLEFINYGIEYIKSNNFNRIIEFEKAKNNNIYVPWKDDIYCIMNLVEGRECEYSNPVDVMLTSRALAQLHRASEGLINEEAFKMLLVKNQKRYLAGKIIQNFNKKLGELRFFKSIATLYENKNEFDYIFLDNEKYYEDNILQSIKILEKSEYNNLCKEKDKIVFCHHDLAHHNILINVQQVYFLDFDYAVVDLKVHDICNFINKAIKNFAYDIEKCHSILNEYTSVNPLEHRELEVLYGMLSFPEDFYSIARDYYTRKKQWSEEVFLSRLKSKVEYREDREEFLEAFKNHYNC